MSVHPVSAKKRGRLSRLTGVDWERIVGGGGYWLEGRTADDRHASIHTHTGEVEWLDPAATGHWTSCQAQRRGLNAQRWSRG